MSVDIEQWCTEIGNCNGHFHGVIMKLELNLFNIISSLSQVLAFIFALLFQYISNVDTAIYFLTIFFVFALSIVVLKFTVHNLFLCFNFSQHINNQISIFYHLNIIKILNVLYSGYFLHLLLLQHGDIESNPGPKKEEIKYISCCHWNVNSTLAQNTCKISQTEAYSYSIMMILSVYQTHFDSSVLEGVINFQLNGYHLIRADHPSNIKREGVCIYHKESLGIHLIKLSNLTQCIVCEVFLQNCKGYIDIYNRHKEITFRSLKNYSAGVYKGTLERVSFPNYENFHNPDIAYSDFITRLDCIINAIAPFKTIRIKNSASEWFD